MVVTKLRKTQTPGMPRPFKVEQALSGIHDHELARSPFLFLLLRKTATECSVRQS